MIVEVWSDVVCPWCYIGKRRLEEAIARSGRSDVEVVHRAFQLDPTAVSSGRRTVDVLAEKYAVPPQQAAAMMGQVSDVARTVGLDYRLEDTVSGNTADAHRVILWADAQGRGQEMAEALMKAYFVDARSIFSREDLLDVVESIGMDRDDAGRMLLSSEYADQVVADQRDAAAIGATSVPTFVFDRQRGFSGAQPLEVFEAALRGDL